MNIGLGSSQPLSPEAEASIATLVASTELAWLDEGGFYSEFRAPMRRTFEALGCPYIFALKEAGSPHAPRPQDAGRVIYDIMKILLSDGAEHAAFIFAAEFDEDSRYASGTLDDLDCLILNGWWTDNRMRIGDRSELHPFYIQEYTEVPFVFQITPPSA